MKKLTFLLILLSSLNCYSQDSEGKIIIEKIDQFFEALEKQDTVLFKSLFADDVQVWSVINRQNSVKYSIRYFQEDIRRFNPEQIIQETPLDYEIKVHNEIATAWIPYKLSVNEKFSHCGIDDFYKNQPGMEDY
ncbi:MAG: hypothetical protein KTR26_06755 [Flammeovirgaceae bacterium]|nr:hypothetical protein [Flammeovirgaceae bacterium]